MTGVGRALSVALPPRMAPILPGGEARPMSKPDPFDDRQVNDLLERISKQAAATVARSSSPRPAGAGPAGSVTVPRFGRRRTDKPRAAGNQELLGLHAVRLLQTLPSEIRLVALRGEYPRILNHIAALWDEPKALARYLDSLMIDSRGGRGGFPFQVIAELAELRNYRARLDRRRWSEN
jgi:hypothetical protein